MIAIDTNIWAYAISQQDPEKQKHARELLNRLAMTDETITLWQVTSEFMNCLYRMEGKGEISTVQSDQWTEWRSNFSPSNNRWSRRFSRPSTSDVGIAYRIETAGSWRRALSLMSRLCTPKT